MVKRTVREVIFFVLAFLLYYLSVSIANYWINHMKKSHSQAIYLLIGLVYRLVLVAVYYLANLNNTNEGFWTVTPAGRCRGGPYMWQGDSQTAKMCRDMAETKEGRCAISSYNCPTGYEGVPKVPFYYTPLSNDMWQNERCMDIPNCPCQETGLCSMDNQVGSGDPPLGQ